MNLAYTPQQRAFRAEARAWMAANVPSHALPSFDLTRDGFEAHRDWERKLNQGRWGMVTWPEELGGRGLDLIRWLIFEEEYYRAGAPTRVNQNGIFLLGPTMMEFGTEDQKARFLPRMAGTLAQLHANWIARDYDDRNCGPCQARARPWSSRWPSWNF